MISSPSVYHSQTPVSISLSVSATKPTALLSLTTDCFGQNKVLFDHLTQICYHEPTMKHLLRVFLFNLFAIWITSQILPTLTIHGDWQTMVLAGLTLGLLMLIIRPILKILFIPINILTFGLLSWFVNVIVLYILTIVVPEVTIKPWAFPGFTWSGLTVPAVFLTYFPALIVTSLIITCITNVFHQVSES
jgi:putative membrane protein